MCVALIVFLLTPENMFNQVGPTTPATADQIACAESLEQGFGLIEPGRIGWSEQHVEARLARVEEFGGLSARMAGPIINNQVNAMCPTIRMKKTLNGRTKMFTIILIQTLGKHMPSIQGQ